MTKKLVYSIRPMPNTRGVYEASVEYMPGNHRTFITSRKNFAWILAEIEKTLDNKIPTVSGKYKTMTTYETRENEYPN